MTGEQKNIDIENIGPIRALRIPLPGNGGVIVLRGRNGLGKTTAIDAVEAAIKGQGSLDVRRGSARGSVDACGVSIRVSRNTRRFGELEVDTLDGKLSVAELVDPGLKDEAAADRLRIRALLHVVQFDASSCGPKFRALLPSEDFDRIVAASSLATKDPVEMARAVKRDLDEEALRLERDAENLSSRAKGLEDAAHGVPAPEGTEDELATALSAATLALDRAEQHDLAVLQAAKARDEAVNTLQVWESAAENKISVSAASEALETSEKLLRQAIARCEELREQLRLAESSILQCEAATTAARSVVAEATTREQAIVKFRQAANVRVDTPTEAGTLAVLRQAKADAATAVSAGGVRRKAQEEREMAANLRIQSSETMQRAETLRVAAKATDDVLTDLVAACGVALSINQGRVVYREGDNERLFGELSMGEKFRIGLDIAIRAAHRLADNSGHGESRGALLTLTQEAWESLDPYNRSAIAAQAKHGNVWIVTAEATGDEDLVAQTFDNQMSGTGGGM